VKRAVVLVVALLAVPRDARAEEVVALGARVGAQSIFLEGDDAPSDLRGWVFGADVQGHVAHHLALVAGLDLSLFNRRSDRLPYGRTSSSYAPFVGVRIDTNPGGQLGVHIELATAIRWLTLPLDSGSTDHYFGVEPLRLRVGPALRVEHRVDLALLVGAAFGWFTARPGEHACAATASCPDSLLDSTTMSSVHFVGDLAIVATWLP
jgi:hypothetical protein